MSAGAATSAGAAGGDLGGQDACLSQDAFLAGRLHLSQFRKGHHRGGTDGVLAAMQAAALAPGRLVDLGAGTGLVGLAVAHLCPRAEVTLVERSPELAALCRSNAAANGLADRVHVVEADVLGSGADRRAAGLERGGADLIVTNPPWFEAGQVRRSPAQGRGRAHVFGETDGASPLMQWLRTASDLSAPGARLVMIHRADALGEILAAAAGRFGGLAIRPIHPRRDEPAIRVLVSARKGSRAAMTIEPALVLHEADGRFTAEAAALHGGLLPADWANG
ncbi:tRNA1(Val) (adenine(37)-N6)-methyltransferase [Chelatococcus reniformis]|uniref:Methyltransferase n=1 Tax=Chelatococcus reniformis TaxID=1494448 RepID=A0A916XBW5_9HYPH|nr:methyltransferase [Chelatococcus reniformis]GGC62568.1 methyltransferase [Chelatococcus reniformis]